MASHGYVALALAYFRYADLPPKLEAIPLEYFGRALGWMLNRSDVLPDQVGVVGTSRGGELALQLAAMYPQLKAVVAYVPANVRYPSCCGDTSVPYAWSWQGRGLAFAMPWRQENPLNLINAEISVEHIHGPVLLIGGEDDHVWPSAAMVDAIAARLERPLPLRSRSAEVSARRTSDSAPRDRSYLARDRKTPGVRQTGRCWWEPLRRCGVIDRRNSEGACVLTGSAEHSGALDSC